MTKEPTLEKIAIGGIKLSSELVLIRFFPKTGFPVEALFRRLTDRQINLTGVTLDAEEGFQSGLCCISAEDRLSVEETLQAFSGPFEIQSSVGTITIFPHQSRLDLMGRLLSTLGQIGLPIYGMASSFSSLTIITDYVRLDDAVSAVCRVVRLPENHAPFRPEFQIKQL
jgi:hypothetical protein